MRRPPPLLFPIAVVVIVLVVATGLIVASRRDETDGGARMVGSWREVGVSKPCSMRIVQSKKHDWAFKITYDRIGFYPFGAVLEDGHLRGSEDEVRNYVFTYDADTDTVHFNFGGEDGYTLERVAGTPRP